VPDIVQILTKLARSLPAMIPGVGPGYQTFLAELSSDQLRAILETARLSEEELRALADAPARIESAIQRLSDETQKGMLEALFTQRALLVNEISALTTSKPAERLTAIIPAGGPGSGLYPLTAGMPKSLLPINTKPMLVHILEGLDSKYFDRAIVVSDVFSPMVESYGKAFFPSPNLGDLKVEYRRIDKPPAQQILDLRDELSDPFVLHYCDVLLGRVRWGSVLSNFRDHRDDAGGVYRGMLFATKMYRMNVGIARTEADPPYIS